MTQINGTMGAADVAVCEREIAIFDAGAGEGAARVLENREAERDRAILSMGRRAGAAGVRAGIRSIVREEFAPRAKETRAAVMSRALEILRAR